MLSYMDTYTLLMAVIAIGICAYFVGLAMNQVLESDGFGVVGNMLILTTGAFLGLIAGARVTIPLPPEIATTMTAIVGAFVCLIALAVIKNVLARFGL